MDFRVTVEYAFRVNANELRLLSRCLRGVELTSEEREEAKQLQEKILEDKHRQILQMQAESQKAVDNIMAARKGENT